MIRARQFSLQVVQLVAFFQWKVSRRPLRRRAEESKRPNRLDGSSVPGCVRSKSQAWYGIQEIITREAYCACLYISVGKNDVRFWILRATGAIHFSKKKVSLDKNQVTRSISPWLRWVFQGELRQPIILPEQNCEDRSLDDTGWCPRVNCTVFRDYDAEDFKTNLHLCYQSKRSLLSLIPLCTKCYLQPWLTKKASFIGDITEGP